MPASTPSTIASVRSFNRFYTRQIGLLNEGLYRTHFPLSQVRVMYELAHRTRTTASDLAKDLGLDAGYLSRLLRALEKQKLLEKTASDQDRRQLLLSLTPSGEELFAEFDAASAKEVASMLDKLPTEDQKRLATAMSEIQRLLGETPSPVAPYILRSHQPGDMGWMVHRHGVLYSQEYGYDERFEALVARIAADFIQKLDRKREHCWIAERHGENVGCVILVKKSNTVAKLRVLLVEPSARGMGIGKRLVEECVRLARRVGYKKIVLWTQSELHAARKIYEQAGFRLTGKQRHDSWGRNNLVAETWELKL